MIEASRPEPAIKEEKLKFFISEITIWYYFNIPEATCKAYLVNEKSRLLSKYYSELFQKYYLPLNTFGVLVSCFSLIFLTQTTTGTMVKRVPQEQIFVIEATLLENHFLPSSGFVMLMSVEDVLIS